jgi:hypothetical protein
MASPSQEHTDRKLRYAKMHLEELCAYPNVGGNDEWENAH